MLIGYWLLTGFILFAFTRCCKNNINVIVSRVVLDRFDHQDFKPQQFLDMSWGHLYSAWTIERQFFKSSYNCTAHEIPTFCRDLPLRVNQINTTRIQAIIQKLTTLGTRHTLSSRTDLIRGIGSARDWIAFEMRAIVTTSNGRMTVITQESLRQPSRTVIPNPTNITNVFITPTESKEPVELRSLRFPCDRFQWFYRWCTGSWRWCVLALQFLWN